MDADRIRNIEVLVMVQDATLAIMSSWADLDYWPEFIVSQVDAARQAHLEIMGEPSMCRSLKPPEKE